MVLILRRPLWGASSSQLSSGSLGRVEFVPYFSISAWSRTEDSGATTNVALKSCGATCLNNKVLFTRRWE